MPLAWYDDNDIALAARPQFLGASGGVPTTAQEFRLWNDFGGGGSPTASNLSLHALGKDFGDTINLECGHEFVDRTYFEARILSGLGALTLATGPWVDLGCPGAVLELPDIPSGSGVAIELRVSAPGDAPNGHYCPLLQLRQDPATELGSVGSAIASGVLLSTDQITRSGGSVVENPGGVDDQVQVPSQFWSAGGAAYASVEQLVQFDGNDGSAASLVAGEAYYGIVYAADDGTIAVVKGDKATTPLSATDEPTVPATGRPLARVLREFDGLINDADISQLALEGAFALSGTTLTVTIGPGEAIVGTKLVRLTSNNSVSLTASSTNTVFLAPSGAFEVSTTGVPATAGALPVWEITTDVSSVTASRDLRAFGGSRKLVPVRFDFPSTMVATDKSYSFWPFPSTGHLRPKGVAAVVFEGAAGSSGSYDWDVEYREPGGSWTSIFPTGSTPPTIPYNATDLADLEAFPGVAQIPGNSELRAVLDAIPAGAPTNEGGQVTLLLEV